MADLVVDVDALDTFGGQLESIRSRMNAARDWTHQYDGQMGASEVEDALHSFASGWKDGRKEIDESLKALSDMLTNSAQTFRQTDSDLAKPLTQQA
ncbi:MAG: hypothetical protein ACJ786_35520 [Catenulispora sp.]